MTNNLISPDNKHLKTLQTKLFKQLRSHRANDENKQTLVFAEMKKTQIIKSRRLFYHLKLTSWARKSLPNLQVSVLTSIEINCELICRSPSSARKSNYTSMDFPHVRPSNLNQNKNPLGRQQTTITTVVKADSLS